MTEATQSLAEMAASLMRYEWASLVELTSTLADEDVKANAGALSVVTKVGAASIERKMNAIRHALAEGLSVEEIIGRGQEKTLGEFVKVRRVANYQETVTTGWRLPGLLKELLEIDMKRIKDVLGIVTTIEWFEWLHSFLSSLSEEEILHSAGEAD